MENRLSPQELPYVTDTATYPDRAATTDEWLWLEDIHGEKPLAWVAEQNARTIAQIDPAALETTRQRVLEVLDSTDRIPFVSKHGDFYYNLWKDAEHPRGLWRRTTPESYRTASPEWDVILDIDALGKSEGTDWVFGGSQLLFPDHTRALLHLSPDGGDAVAIREFDLESRAFVDDGFAVPVAKTGISWVDANTVLISSDFGAGTLTISGYPRQVRRWTRGTPLAEAEIVLEIDEHHMGAWAGHDHTVGFERDLIIDRESIFSGITYVLKDGHLDWIQVPNDAEVGFHREWLTIELRSDWNINDTTYPAGSLLATDVEEFMDDDDREFEVLFTPDAHTSLAGSTWTRNHLLLTTLRDVASRVEVLTPDRNGWTRQDLGTVAPNQSINVEGVDEDESDDYWLMVTGFLQPSALQMGTIGSDELETVKEAPSFFDGSRFEVAQHFATSKDGTRIPYFQVSPKDLVLDGTAPTLLNGYGGFEIPLTPGYDGSLGRAWLEQGGVYVLANIRGGGEYGPAWHQAALRGNRHRAYEDFAAVAQDLIARNVTSPAHLGCMGGSNGGLLVGNMLTHYPELFGAIVCQVPLLDMQRYSRLSAGNSWISEYGDPEIPEDWAFIQTFSPYHNLRDGVTYPPVLFYTATSDDRVGPVQARKMAARMQERGIPNVLMYENREGGHGGAADNAQRAHMVAMGYEFLREHLT